MPDLIADPVIRYGVYASFPVLVFFAGWIIRRQLADLKASREEFLLALRLQAQDHRQDHREADRRLDRLTGSVDRLTGKVSQIHCLRESSP
jgi:phosphoserine phosphatase